MRPAIHDAAAQNPARGQDLQPPRPGTVQDSVGSQLVHHQHHIQSPAVRHARRLGARHHPSAQLAQARLVEPLI
jgi:hypothetical protein